MNIFARYNLLIICLLASMSAGAADDYLKMLEQEASHVQLDETGQLHEEQATDAQAKTENAFDHRWGSSSELPAGLNKADFESFLQNRFYGTYVFYRKLDSNDRDTVFYRYEKSESVSVENVRKDTLELLRKH